jgi:hypothetical protein
MARGWWLVAVLLASCGHQPAPHAPGPAQASLPEPRNLDEACARWKCRPPTIVRLDMPQGWYEITVGRSAYVDGKVVRIVAGETLAVTGDIQGDQLVNLRLVDPPGDSNVLLLHFEQKKLKNEPSMILQVHNRFPRPVKYRATMQMPERNGFHETRSCPVRNGKAAFELWPHAIISLLLNDVRFVDNAAMACE